MGHRFSKPQRQLTTDSQTVVTAPHSCSDQPPDTTVAETTATPRVSLQQVSAIVITICMLKVDGEPPVIDSPPSTVMSSLTGSCARHASDVVHSINGNASSNSSSCDACAQLQQLQLLSLDNCSDRLLADQSTASASASSSKSAAATTTTTAPTRAAVAVQQPPLISMRDIAGDSADDDDDDCDDNETLRLRITPVAAAIASLPSDKHNNNRVAGTTTSPTAVSIDNNNAITIANYKKTVLLAAQLATSNNCGESARQKQQPQQQQQQQQQQQYGGNANSESVGASLIAANTDQQDGGGISDGRSENLYASLLSGSSDSSIIATAGCVDCKRPPAPQQHRKKSLPTTATPCTSCGRPTPAVAVSIVGKPKTKSSWKLNCAKLITGKASASGSCSSSNSSPHSTASVFNVSAASCAAIVGASVVVSSSSSSGALHASSTVALDKSTACVGTSYRRMDDRELIATAVPAATARGSADIYLLPSLQQQQQQRSSAAHSGHRQRIANDPTDDDGDDDDDDYNHDHQHHQQQAAGAANRTHHSVATTATACATAAVQQMLLQSLHSGAGPPPSLCAQSPSSSSGGHPQLGNSAMGSIVIHSQVEYVHCLVPDLQRITASAFYWGKMDRYEAERLLDGKPEGTFLLRDSAQEEFLFSVSFRKYARSLHARIEQFNHKFSFDCHDPGVYTSDSVTGLLEHYKDPACVMFFEPALTLPLTRNYCFTLQELCRAAIVSRTSYDGVAELQLPVTLRAYLREYHYRKRVRVQRFDEPSLTVSAAYEPTTTVGGLVDSATGRQPQTFAEPLDDGSASNSFTSITK